MQKQKSTNKNEFCLNRGESESRNFFFNKSQITYRKLSPEHRNRTEQIKTNCDIKQTVLNRIVVIIITSPLQLINQPIALC